MHAPRATDRRRPFAPWRSVRGRMLSGLSIVVPLVVTWYAVRLVYSLTAGALLPLLAWVSPGFPRAWLPLVASLAVVGLLYMTGLLVGLYVGRHTVALVEEVLRRIPLVRTIYRAAKEVVAALFSEPRVSADRIAAVQYPRLGLWTIAFVGGTVRLPDGTPCYRIYVATPHPGTGALELVPCDAVVPLDMSLEDAIKLVVSGGLLSPDALVSTVRRPPAESSA